ncbi:hypothetical protein [Deinococcus petrolearius]|uniref:Uncharacterized protein n=1 Tax=Deinococcus petrolearius TaxID=1751295 RepID=A0ABW1DJD1_9DEIO
MTRVVFFLLGVALLAVTALGALWLLGQLLAGLGAFIAGTAGVLLRLLWFLAVAGLLGGVAFFLAGAWRPARTGPPQGAGCARARSPGAGRPP